MVVSKLNGEINYEEIKQVQEGDRQHESSIYVINIGDVPVMIVLGGEKYTYIAKNIIYIPIYLVYKGVVKEKRPISYMDAIVWYCETNKIEIETVSRLISKPLKEKIKAEALNANLLKEKKTGTLPV